MTPIGSKITLESAKTNRLQPCLLHSSSAELIHTLPFKATECADRLVEGELDKKREVLLIFHNDRVSTR